MPLKLQRNNAVETSTGSWFLWAQFLRNCAILWRNGVESEFKSMNGTGAMLRSVLLLLAAAVLCVSQSLRDRSGPCPITADVQIVYSLVEGVGPASKIWVEDLLWWWKAVNPSLNYLAVHATALRHCDLSAFENLRIFINPGGNAYDQLVDMGAAGADNIKRFVYRNQKDPSAYVGFCAGGYVAAHDYLWESIYEGTDFYNFQYNPPLSLFPHTVEGSIVDINDDQYGDQHGSKFRAVNVSNGHLMLYYGGSTFGWSASPDYADEASVDYDDNLEVLLYYSDFYGFHTHNLPAAWRYRTASMQHTEGLEESYIGHRFNVLLTSVHPEADNCTFEQNSDCPPAGTLPEEIVLQNRAWLCHYMNEAAMTTFTVPPVPLEPVFDTTAPHVDYPVQPCYDRPARNSTYGEYPIFCDDFEASAADGGVPYGLSINFQRNQSSYQYVAPWNTSFIRSWNDGIVYTDAYEGSGYAINVPQSASSFFNASITSRFFSAYDQSKRECKEVVIRYAYIMVSDNPGGRGSLTIEVQTLSDAAAASDEGFKVLAVYYNSSVHLEKHQSLWQQDEVPVSLRGMSGAKQLRLRFICNAGPSIESFCALDDLNVYCIS